MFCVSLMKLIKNPADGCADFPDCRECDFCYIKNKRGDMIHISEIAPEKLLQINAFELTGILPKQVETVKKRKPLKPVLEPVAIEQLDFLGEGSNG